eukprot:EG_transcript_10663
MGLLQRDLRSALERALNAEQENEALRLRVTTAEDLVFKLRERSSNVEEQLACYEMGGDALLKFMKHFSYCTADEAIHMVENLRRTMEARDEQFAAYEAKHASLEEQLVRLSSSTAERATDLANKLADAEAAKAKAEQGLRTLQREHAELAARGRTLAGEEEQHRRLREAVGEWHTGWMEKAKYWNYLPHAPQGNTLAMLTELQELANQFINSRVSLLYQDICGLAHSIREEFFAEELEPYVSPMAIFQRLRQRLVEVSAELAEVQEHVAAGNLSPNTPQGGGTATCAEGTAARDAVPDAADSGGEAGPPKPDSVQAAVQLLHRRRQRLGSRPSPQRDSVVLDALGHGAG